jgi:hypothetical protein
VKGKLGALKSHDYHIMSNKFCHCAWGMEWQKNHEGSWRGWVDQNLAKKTQCPFCKLYSVHNVDTWWWQNDIYPFLVIFFHMWFLHCRG